MPRRSSTGRRMVAIRGNERAAAALDHPGHEGLHTVVDAVQVHRQDAIRHLIRHCANGCRRLRDARVCDDDVDPAALLGDPRLHVPVVLTGCSLVRFGLLRERLGVQLPGVFGSLAPLHSSFVVGSPSVGRPDCGG